MLFPENGEKFERRVSDMVDSIDKGWEVPPLISWYLEDGHSIADGTHRHEALLRAGYFSYWVFIFFSTKDDMRKFNRERSGLPP